MVHERSSETVSEIMSRNPFCARRSTTLESLTRSFLELSISGAAVVDEEAMPIGMVSKTDLLRALRSGKQSTAEEVMSGTVFCLPEAASIAQAAALMAFEGVRHVPIIDKAGKIVGQVSTHDVLRWMARREGYLIP